MVAFPIVLIDWAIVKGKKEKGYVRHFVLIVGSDKKNIYVHSPSLGKSESFYQIKRDLFEQAEKAQWTDEDIVIISNKA